MQASSRSNRETEPSHTEAERKSHVASNISRMCLSLVRSGTQKVPQTRAISYRATENATMARLGRSRGDLNCRSSFRLLVLTKGSKFQRGHCAKADERIILRAICWQNRPEKQPGFGPFFKAEKAKKDRQFESPLLPPTSQCATLVAFMHSPIAHSDYLVAGFWGATVCTIGTFCPLSSSF